MAIEIAGSRPAPMALTFSRSPIRCQIIAGAVWFSSDDIHAAAKLPIREDAFANYAAEHYGLQVFDGPQGPEVLLAVTSLGACTIAVDARFPIDNILSAWVRKQARVLAAQEGEVPTAEPLTYLADGRVPARPKKSTDLYDEWQSLEWGKRWGHECIPGHIAELNKTSHN